MSPATSNQDFVWVVVDKQGGQASFMGLSQEGQAQDFIPVTADRDQGLMLMGRLPAPPAGVTRELEAVHRNRLLQWAKAEGFSVYLVDAQGRVTGQL